MNGQIFLNLRGTPPTKNSICLGNSHGHYAYVSTKSDFIHEFFKNISIWGAGPTDTYTTRDGRFYSQYELDCRDKTFFKSMSFKKICEKHDVELIIFDDDSDDHIIINFWDQMKCK